MFCGLLDEKSQPLAVHCVFIGLVVLYALVGAVVFHAIEGKSGSSPQNVSYLTPPLTKEGELCVKTVLNKTSKGVLKLEQAIPAIQECYKQPIEPDTGPDWGFMSSLLFTFTVITTIGYGNIAPVTTEGQVFCICYGLIGIPLTMLAIANVGKFLVEGSKYGGERMQKFFGGKIWMFRKKTLDSSTSEKGEEEEEMSSEFGSGAASMAVILAFMIYVGIGAIVLPLYEENMSFFSAIYFNFVTLTTVGLGDMVPQNREFLFFTLFYVTVGLALTTIAIEIASDYLKKLHYFGRKLKNAANVTIWFGGKKITVGALMKNVGEKYGIPEHEFDNLTFFDNLVEEAIVKDENKNYEKPSPVKPVMETDLKETENGDEIVYVDEEDELDISKPLIENVQVEESSGLKSSVPPALPLPARKRISSPFKNAVFRNSYSPQGN